MTAGIIDEITAGRGYPLPHGDNPLRRDVGRIRDSLSAIDEDVTEIRTDAAEAKARLTALFEQLLDGVSEDGNTLAKLLHLIQTIDVSGPLNATKAEIIGDAPAGRQTLGDVNEAADWAQAQADAALAAAVDADSDAAAAQATANTAKANAATAQSTADAAKATANAALPKTGGTISGSLGMTGSLTVGDGQTSSVISMVDTDEGTRSLHNNSGSIGFLGSDGAWKFRAYDNGSIWCAQLGDINSRIESRGQEWGAWGRNQAATNVRLAYITDESVAAQFNGGMREPWGATVFTGRTTVLSNDRQDIIVNVLRNRQLQFYTANSGWVAGHYA